MKKVVRIVAYLFGGVVLLIAGALAYLKIALPDVGSAPELKVEITDEKIQRGSYLANHVMLCMDCHSTRDWSLFSGPMVAGSEGKGGEVFDQTLGFPGKYIAPNITPYALRDWTDGEIFRAVTAGVSRDGRALFSIMPHHNYGKTDPTDIEAVIAYLRQLKPIETQHEASVSDFPMNFIINTLPQKAAFSEIPPATDLLAYGKYVVTAAGCMDCHTKQDKGKFVGEFYAGGFEFIMPSGGVVRSSNITPDSETGIGKWTQEQFVQGFKKYADTGYVAQKVPSGEFQTPMPWTMYAGMKETDLQAVFVYLQSLPPVANAVERFSSEK
jgi:hypothetical protein